MFMILIAGFIAGLIHVLAGPDHLAAIAPLAVKDRQRAWTAGLRWGIGHSAGVALIGTLSLLLRGLIPVGLISGWSERLVGVLLIGIGFWALRKALRVHVHEHVHDGEVHVHLHAHAPGEDHSRSEAHTHGHAAFGIGTLHGLAGSSHFLGIVPALALPSNEKAVIYLLAFAVGTVAAMIVFASAVGTVSHRFATGVAYRGLMYACSGAAFAVGAAWLIH